MFYWKGFQQLEFYLNLQEALDDAKEETETTINMGD